MKKAILIAIVGAMTLGVKAGDWSAKAPVKAPIKDPIEECVDVGGEISSGYKTDYIFKGVRFARDSVWTDVNYTFDRLRAPVTIGAWYLNGINSPFSYDELDLYARADLGSWRGFDASLGYVHYFFPENPAAGSYGEIGLDIRRSLGIVDAIWETDYALNGRRGSSGGWYHKAGLERTFGVSDAVSLVLGAGVGYSDGYFGTGTTYGGLVPNAFTPRQSGWNHYYVNAALPIELNCRATLTPYIGYVGGPDTWIADGIAGVPGQAQSDILHGGVSLSVSF